MVYYLLFPKDTPPEMFLSKEGVWTQYPREIRYIQKLSYTSHIPIETWNSWEEFK